MSYHAITLGSLGSVGGNVWLSSNFSLNELTKTSSGLNNQPAYQEYDRVVSNLQSLAQNVLQPARDHFQKPVHVNSGFRNKEVNEAAEGVPNSQHRKGEAADIEIFGVDNLTLARWIAENTDFDQLILEHYNGGNSGWVHVSRKKNGPNRKQVLRVPGKGAKSIPGLPSNDIVAKAEYSYQKAVRTAKVVGVGSTIVAVGGLVYLFVSGRK